MRVKRRLLILLTITQLSITGAAAQDPVDAASSVQTPLENSEALPVTPGLLQMLQQIEAMEMEISHLRGELEVQNHVLEQIKKRQRDLYTDIDKRLQRFEMPLADTIETTPGEAEPPLQTLSPFTGAEETGGGQQTEMPLTLELVGQGQADGKTDKKIVSPVASPEQQSEPVSGEVRSGTATDLGLDVSTPGIPGKTAAVAPAEVYPERLRAEFQKAYDLLEASHHDRSITAFREFQARYPGSEYADKAHFWLGEAYFINNRFDQALEEYNALLQNYPGSGKLVQAKLKAGFCQHELGLIEPAIAQLTELIQQHPGTTAARLAQERLKKIATGTVPADMTPVN